MGQAMWDAEVGSNLRHVQRRITTSPECKLPGWDEVIIRRLRLGHAHATHHIF